MGCGADGQFTTTFQSKVASSVELTGAKRRVPLLLISLVAFLVALKPATGEAAKRGHRRYSHRRRVVHVLNAPPYRALLLEDADTGQILYAYNEHLTWPPASMAKMMLLLVAEDQIRAGRFSLSDPVRISITAASTGGSRLGLRAGEVHPLGELMKAALIRSANDAAVAVAEKIAGSTEACVRMMNQRAQALHMYHTFFGTVDGLPPVPGHDVDFTDAYDMGILAREIIHQTDLLKWSSMENALFDGGAAILHNTNRLIGHFEGCDGIKTGFTHQAGFNLTATAKRGDMRLIAVVLGAPTSAERFRQVANLLEWGFRNFVVVEPLKQGQVLPVSVRVGANLLVQPIAAKAARVLVRRDEVPTLRLEYQLPTQLAAPLPAGTPLGTVMVRDGMRVVDQVSALYPDFAANSIYGATLEPKFGVALNPAAGAYGQTPSPTTGSW